MKITKKIIEMVEVTTTVEKEVEKTIFIENIVEKNSEHFQDTIDYMKTLRYVESSCRHNKFEDFISRRQGGNNCSDITYIRLIHDHYGKLTFEVRWTGYNKESDGAIIILSNRKD